jgi:diacylglycerol kinase family enzyme
MKTIKNFIGAMEISIVPSGTFNPLSKRAEIELNEHVKRKQNE